jgi:hypothetical protein
MWKGYQLAIISLLALMAMMALVSIGDTPIPSDNRIMCDSCHDDFEPFSYSLDAPSEVPPDRPFDVSVTIRNDGDHTLSQPRLVIDLGSESRMVIEGGESWTDDVTTSGTLGFQESTIFPFDVDFGALEARFQLDISGGLLDQVSFTVQDTHGGILISGGTTGSIGFTLDQTDLQQGGQGQYMVSLIHDRGFRNVPYDLAIEIDYGASLGWADGPDLSPGESHTLTVRLVGTSKGDSQVPIHITGIALYEHHDDGLDERPYTIDTTVDIEVGDKFVSGDGGSGGGGGGTSLLSAGQALGITSALLLIGSLATSGLLPKLPKRGKIHCYLSYGLAGLFLVHWLTLWVGPYGGTLGGIETGSVMLLLIFVLAVGGVRPNLLEGKVLGWSNRILHRNLTYVLILILVAHVLINGSHFAFVRGG